MIIFTINIFKLYNGKEYLKFMITYVYLNKEVQVKILGEGDFLENTYSSKPINTQYDDFILYIDNNEKYYGAATLKNIINGKNIFVARIIADIIPRARQFKPKISSNIDNTIYGRRMSRTSLEKQSNIITCDMYESFVTIHQGTNNYINLLLYSYEKLFNSDLIYFENQYGEFYLGTQDY